MATTLLSPGGEQKIDKEAETLRTVVGTWARKVGTKFQKKWENLEDCVDSNRWMHAGPFLAKVGLQKEVLGAADCDEKLSLTEIGILVCNIESDWHSESAAACHKRLCICDILRGIRGIRGM
jgi:hypothetical protein